MNIAPRRFAASALALAAVALTGAAASGEWPSALPFVLIALLWLLLLGWGFHALLGRHLRFNDRLVCSEAQLGLERQARALAERVLADTHASLCRLVHQQEQVRETERNRIARDIHDDLGQQLLAMKMALSLMQVSSCGADTPVRRQIRDLLNNLDLTFASLRAIINDLRPPVLEQGLLRAMQQHLAEFSRLNGIRHQFAADSAVFEGGQDRTVDAMLFRILQESLSNVARHAQATEVRIALGRSAGLLTLKVQDDGVGILGQPGTQGRGLAGIADRVAAAGGKFAIDSQPGAGTLISLSIPQPPLSAR
ncbi:MAG: Two-component sensor histidine kinase [Massilia sp.]|nr:Two-component sensor histidine kinase [Massilia sp.]